MRSKTGAVSVGDWLMTSRISARRRLLLQRLLRLVEEARVLDGDHRLVAEQFGLGDLLRAEQVGPCPTDADDADALAFAHEAAARARS